ncbi:carbon-monoxide dehydrogenase medium subunit [Rhizobium skierniewicense]|uniref:Carbon-monoxide dehydrogenase medium subunit n=1 Tax=Rhizobium skierniewicense TaxID=984260 RepID=A0A7W6C9S2_9HYPH|nr:FAD binding domain-containing protein [Rhizobium skierniewicense]MBB3944475.1 carbon-monoxide dehydrogenase medium subunit [Rhizobium skierniewicense]
MVDNLERSLTVAGTIGEALAAKRRGAAILAGGTWLMRDPRRGISLPRDLVSVHALDGLKAIDIDVGTVTIGASVTHEALGQALRGVAGLEAIASAASVSANPAIRRVATVGGNLCTSDFSAADLVPALLAVDAIVELRADHAQMRWPLSSFLANRQELLADAIMTRILVPRATTASVHIRLPLRRAGDYPVAIVSCALSSKGRINVAVGSVEDVARRWTSLEDAFSKEPGGRPATAQIAASLARECNDFNGRDGIEADSWYRCQVLPALVRRGMETLLREDAS